MTLVSYDEGEGISLSLQCASGIDVGKYILVQPADSIGNDHVLLCVYL
jgi:hypothetical protein